MADAFLLAEVLCLVEFPYREGFGAGGDGDCVVAERVMGDLQKERRVDASGEGDGDRSELLKILLEGIELCVLFCRSGEFIWHVDPSVRGCHSKGSK